MADLLVSLDDLRIWTRESIDAQEDVEFATAVIEAVSLRVAEELEFADFLSDPASDHTKSARSVALQVARRTYLNPDQETRTAAIGPIGGVAYLDDFAQALTLTESEQERLAKLLATAGAGSSGNGIGVIRIERDDPLMYQNDIVLQDDKPGSSGIIYGAAEDANAFGGPV